MSNVFVKKIEEKWDKSRWYALHTRSRHENVVYQQLSSKGIETFLPLRKIKRHWSDRIKVVEDPLFKGYLFVHIPLRKHLDVVSTFGAVRLIGFSPAEPLEVPERDILAIRKFLDEEIQVDPFPYLKEGERIYVRSGIFKGVEGFIVRKQKDCRLVISLDLLMTSISIHIDEACVELS